METLQTNAVTPAGVSDAAAGSTALSGAVDWGEAEFDRALAAWADGSGTYDDVLRTIYSPGDYAMLQLGRWLRRTTRRALRR